MNKLQDQERFSGYVFTKEKHSYDGRHGAVIDLGLGVSPLGAACELAESFIKQDAARLFAALTCYANDAAHRDMCRLALDYLQLPDMPSETVILSSHGSMGAADEVVGFLARRSFHTIYVPTYSFPDIYRLAVRHRLAYRPLSSTVLHPIESAAAIMELGWKQLAGSIVYLDYPNNPFGADDPALMRQLALHAVQHGAVPVIDVAFAETLGDEFFAAVRYVTELGGVCLGTLSKTQGLPHLRFGYAVIAPQLLERYDSDQRLIFLLNPLAIFVLNTLLDCRERPEPLASLHAKRVREYNAVANSKLYAGLEQLGLTVGLTDPHTHLQVVISDLPDFWQRLLSCGIITESLYDYRQTIAGCTDKTNYLGNRAVRMLTPGPGKIEATLARIRLALSL